MSLSSRALLLLATCHLSFSFLVNKHQVDKYQIGLDRNTSDHRLDVTLYYESLCPDSRAWVVYQLYPAWEVLKDIFHFTLVPYGKAFVRKLRTKAFKHCTGFCVDLPLGGRGRREVPVCLPAR